MTFFKIMAMQAMALLAAAFVATLFYSILIAPPLFILGRPGGFIIITLINTLPYIVLGIAISALRYMVGFRIFAATIAFLAIISIFQFFSILVSAPSLHITRYYENVPLFIDGRVTAAGIIFVVVDIITAAAAFALASMFIGIYKRGVEK